MKGLAKHGYFLWGQSFCLEGKCTVLLYLENLVGGVDHGKSYNLLPKTSATPLEGYFHDQRGEDGRLFFVFRWGNFGS